MALDRDWRWVLVDGFLAGSWTIEREPGRATLAIKPFEKQARPQRLALEEEGIALLAFAAADVDKHSVRFAAP